MKDSFSNMFSKITSWSFNKLHKGKQSRLGNDNPYFSEITLNNNVQNLFKEFKVKNLIQHDSPLIDANELVFDSIKAFQSPFKTSVLVCEGDVVTGTLNLSDVLSNLFVSFGIKSNIDYGNPVRCIMNRVFIPLDYNSSLSEILVDILNCESSIHPVYHKNCVKGVLHKETVLDIVKLQMLFDTIQK